MSVGLRITNECACYFAGGCIAGDDLQIPELITGTLTSWEANDMKLISKISALFFACGMTVSMSLANAASFTARPSTEPLATVDLSGTWDFTPQGRQKTTIQVPGGGWGKQGFTDVVEADYETTISVADIGQPQVTWLEFGAVNYQADLYIDDQFIATSVQAYTPASFDISDYVEPGQTHAIRVHVKGMGARMHNGRSIDPNGAASWAFEDPENRTHVFLPSGIFRSAELKIYPQVYISDVFVRPSVKSTELSYDVCLRNESDSAATLTLSGSLDSWNGDAWEYPALPSQAISLAAGVQTNITVGPLSWDLGTDSYWWPNVPYEKGYQAKLHDLKLALSLADDEVHKASVRFGFRECTQEPDGLGNTCYFLNGIRVNFRGDSLQGANYDRIDYGGGQGNAYDTYPGFLSGENGWPKAVDNFQRLNYNVVRIHQIPASPYMLDVCDEMGLMIINETAIRGAGDQQDFTAGWDNMVNHTKALFTRDRNHASILKLSVANEPDWSGSAGARAVEFIEDLYNAAMEVDGTRPISIDTGAGPYNEITHPNFALFPHYGEYNNKWGQYTDEVYARADRPYGCGEFIWDKDNTRQGFAWFATATQAMRAKGASDTRPYTLLSAWSSVIPGTKTRDMRLENPPWNAEVLYPLYGEDNLSDPWSNSQILRLQAAYNPVLVADAEYWEATKLSNAHGDWPAATPFLAPNKTITRTLNIYNDTFSGTDVDVFWELRKGSATGEMLDSGEIHATVPLGYVLNKDITFTTPSLSNGSVLYLMLRAEKNGLEMFREESARFTVVNQEKLSGEAFGTTPSYAPGNEYDKASDGNVSTFFDYAQANGGYTGIDLGPDNEAKVSYILYTPRGGHEGRMVGGQFQGSKTGEAADYTTLHTVESEPQGATTVLIDSKEAYRYLRYVAPDGSYGNIAEMTFFSYLPDSE